MKERDIKHICGECASDRVEILSVREKINFSNGNAVPNVEITYICSYCGNKKTETYYLCKERVLF